MSESNKNINMLLGDIIEIISPDNDLYNEKIYLIQYIDSTQIHITSENEKQFLNIDADSSFADKSIKEINILYRNDELGFVKQNNLELNTWIDIYFNGDLPTIITGKISDIQEDLIEITSYPSNDVLYIDFAYKGIPLKLNIEKILIRDKSPEKEYNEETKPRTEEVSDEVSDKVSEVDKNTEEKEEEEEEEEKEEGEGEEEEEEDYIERLRYESNEQIIDNKEEVNIGEIMTKVKEIIIGEDLDDIELFVKVPSSEKRYGIDIQISDLLSDMMSKLEGKKNKRQIENDIHIMITRFQELREEFSNYDNNENIYGFKNIEDNHKPLLQKIKYAKEKIPWIIPVVKIKNKLCTNEDDINDDVEPINSLSLKEDFSFLSSFLKDKNNYEGDKYSKYLSNLHNIQKPFSDLNEENNYYSTYVESNNIFGLIDNDVNNRYRSSIIKNGIITQTKYNFVNYNTYSSNNNDINKNDKITISSLLVLPKLKNKYKTLLPTSSLYRKCINNNTYNLRLITLLKHNKPSQVYVTNELEHIDKLLILNNNTVNDYIMDNINNDEDELKTTDELFNDHLEKIIPSVNDCLNNIITYFHNRIPMGYYKDINSKRYNLSINDLIDSFDFFGFDNNIFTNNNIQLVNEIIKNNRELYNADINRTKKMLNIYNNLYKDNSVKEKNTKNEINKFYNDYKNTEDKSSIELLVNANNHDFSKLLFLKMAIENNELVSVESVNGLLQYYMEKIEKQKKGIEISCNDYIITKKYYSEESINMDNNKEIYFDKEYDDTVYDILDVYKNERTKKKESDFKLFLIEKLQEVNGFTEEQAKYMSESLINKKKKVLNGQYAILEEYSDYDEYLQDDEMGPNDSILDNKYYKRIDNEWVFDEDVTEKNKKDATPITGEFCNIQDKCVKPRGDLDYCENMDTMSDKNKEKIIKQMLDEYSHTISYSQEESKQKIQTMYDKQLLLLNKINKIQETDRLKYNNFNKQCADSITDEIYVESPYLKIFNTILEEEDLSIKYENLVNFAKYYTRSAVRTEDETWRYCIETNIKLLPIFMFRLAVVYIKNGDYEKELENIRIQYGKISDDGDTWVDKNSGYVIKKRDFSDADIFDDKGYKQVNESIEEDIVDIDDIEEDNMYNELGDIMLDSNNSNKVAEKDITTISKHENSEYIISIIALFFKKIDIIITKEQVNFIIYYTNYIYDSFFYDKVKDKKTKEQKLLMLTISLILTSMQIFSHSIKNKKTYSGCVYSFVGFPLYEDEVYDGLVFVACVCNALGKESIKNNPFKLFKKIKDVKLIESTLKTTINNYILSNLSINQLLQEERIKLLQEKNNINNISSWDNFSPPLIDFKLQPVNNYPTSFFDELDKKTSLINKNIKYSDLLESKNIFISYYIIQLINTLIKKKIPLLTTLSNEPFIENTCCNDDNDSIIEYFIREDKSLLKYIEMIDHNGKLKNNINSILKSPILSTKKIYNKSTKIEHTFNEKTIYSVFIENCKWNSDKNIELKDNNEEIIYTEDSIYQKDDSFDDKILKLKEAGKQYNNETLLLLLQKINNRNSINGIFSSKKINNIQKLREFIQEYNTIQEQIGSERLNTEFENFFVSINKLLDMYDISLKESEVGKIQQYIELQNILGENIKNIGDRIYNFIEENTSINDNEKRHINDFIYNMNKFNKSFINTYINKENNIHIDNNSSSNSINFMKNVIHKLSYVIPYTICNSVDYTYINNKGNPELIVPNSWRFLSSEHVKDIREFIETNILVFKKFYTNIPLQELLKEVSLNTELINTLSEITPFFCAYINNEKIVQTLFDERTLQLIYHFYILAIIDIYITLLNDINMSEIQYNIFKSNVADLLKTTMLFIMNKKNTINISYESVMKRILHSQVREKNKITQKFDDMQPDQREVEREKKLRKLGDWGKALQKGVVEYSRDVYDKEKTQSDELDVYIRMEQNEQNDISNIREDGDDVEY